MKRQFWSSRVYFAFVVMMSVVLLATLQAAGYADAGVRPAPPEAEEGGPYVPPLQPPPRNANKLTTTYAPAAAIPNRVLDMKVLVIDGSLPYEDGIYKTATVYLDILGIPYDTLNTSADGPEGTVEASDLWDGESHGYYYAIFITTSNVWWGLSGDEQAVLETYMRDFGVRQVTWYAYPSPTPYGLDFARVVTGDCGTTPGNPFYASLTTEGATTLHFLKPDIDLPIDGPCFYGYLGRPSPGADVTPLLVDDEGDTLLVVYRPSDGREHLVMTIGSFYPAIPPGYIHARLLPYGLINWATRGLFLGERHFYFTPQPDDVLGWGDAWDVDTHWYIFDDGYRNTPADLENLVAWQSAFRTTPNAAAFRIELPFNGDGAEEDIENGAVVPGTLTAKAQELQEAFIWLNHTYTHRDLDVIEVPYPAYDTCYAEIYNNTLRANFLGFTDYTNLTLLTGDYSGLSGNDPVTGPYPANPDLADAAFNLGVRFMAVNASMPEYNNPTPNTGISHPTRPEILLVPRYANNIYYAVTTPEQETDLYNIFYCPTYPGSGYSVPCFTYDQIMESITNQALGFLLDYSVNATMFHMNNFGDYGGGKTLMTDYIERLYEKYNRYYHNDVPVLSLRTQEIGGLMRQRMAYNDSGVTGQLGCGNTITLHTVQPATIPLTGLDYGGQVEIYAGQVISYLEMGADETLVIPGEAARVPTAVSDLSITRSGADIHLAWSPTTQDTLGEPLAAAAYRIYARANDPYFTPTPADLLAEVSDPSFIHINGVGDVENNYTYVVTAVGDNCWHEESAVSNRVGEFDFPLLTDTSLDKFNMITLPMELSVSITPFRASGLAAYVGPGVKQILAWDPAYQGYASYVPDFSPTFADFPLVLGGTYLLEVNSSAVTTLSFAGAVPPQDSVVFALSPGTASECSFNSLSVPLNQTAITKASDLAASVGGVDQVLVWNAALQGYNSFVPGSSPSFADFAVRLGYPYLVCLDDTAPLNWP